jgi:hypothetical protein
MVATCGVAAIALALDTGLLTRVSLASTAAVEQGLVDKIKPPPVKSVVIGDADMVMNGPDAVTGSPAHFPFRVAQLRDARARGGKLSPRDAASVLPEPVGAAISTCSPARMAGHA